MKNTGTKRYDIAGNSFLRVYVLNLLNKVFPIGNLRQGVGFKPGLVLLLLHWFGRPLFSLLIRNERNVHRLYQFFRKGC